MPGQLRVFDHVVDQYRVWALVRHARPLQPEADKAQVFEVGVAFVGKRPPRSYEEDPARRYDIASSATETMLAEGTEQLLRAVPSTDHREYTRHNIPVDMLLGDLGRKGPGSPIREHRN